MEAACADEDLNARGARGVLLDARRRLGRAKKLRRPRRRKRGKTRSRRVGGDEIETPRRRAARFANEPTRACARNEYLGASRRRVSFPRGFRSCNRERLKNAASRVCVPPRVAQRRLPPRPPRPPRGQPAGTRGYRRDRRDRRGPLRRDRRRPACERRPPRQRYPCRACAFPAYRARPPELFCCSACLSSASQLMVSKKSSLTYVATGCFMVCCRSSLLNFWNAASKLKSSVGTAVRVGRRPSPPEGEGAGAPRARGAGTAPPRAPPPARGAGGAPLRAPPAGWDTRAGTPLGTAPLRRRRQLRGSSWA